MNAPAMKSPPAADSPRTRVQNIAANALAANHNNPAAAMIDLLNMVVVKKGQATAMGRA